MLLYVIITLGLVAAGFLYFNTRSGSGNVSVNKSELLKTTTDKKKKNKKNKPEKKAVTTAVTTSDSDDTEEAKFDTIDVAELYGLNKKKEVVVEQPTESKKKAKKATEQKSSKKGQKEEDPTFQVVKRPELTGRKKDEKKAEPKVESKKQQKSNDGNKSIFKKFNETKKEESDEEQDTKKKTEAKQADSNSEGSDSEEEVAVQATVAEKKEKRHTVVRDPYVTEDDFWNSNTREVVVEVVETKPKKAVEKSTAGTAKIVVTNTTSSNSASWNQKEEGKAADESSFPKVGAKKNKK